MSFSFGETYDDIITLSSEGYKEDEIAALLGYSKKKVRKILETSEENCDVLYYLKRSCDDLGYRKSLATKVYRALRNSGIIATALTDEELLDIPGIGERGAELIDYAIFTYHVSFDC